MRRSSIETNHHHRLVSDGEQRGNIWEEETGKEVLVPPDDMALLVSDESELASPLPEKESGRIWEDSDKEVLPSDEKQITASDEKETAPESEKEALNVGEKEMVVRGEIESAQGGDPSSRKKSRLRVVALIILVVTIVLGVTLGVVLGGKMRKYVSHSPPLRSIDINQLLF
jgi:hypothetical protein